jgi:hypothetical protein
MDRDHAEYTECVRLMHMKAKDLGLEASCGLLYVAGRSAPITLFLRVNGDTDHSHPVPGARIDPSRVSFAHTTTRKPNGAVEQCQQYILNHKIALRTAEMDLARVEIDMEAKLHTMLAFIKDK